MSIDSHQHFWRYTPNEFGWITRDMSVLERNFLPQDFKKDLYSAGFDGSIAVQARQCLEESEWLLDLADKNDFIKGVVGWVDLCSIDAEKQVAQLARHRAFVGARHIVQDEPDDEFMLRTDFLAGIQSLQVHNKTYDIVIHPRHLRTAGKLVAQFPHMRFVLDHCAKPGIRSKTISPWAEEVTSLSRYPNVFCKLSGLVTEADWQHWRQEDFLPYLDVVVDAFGPERLMIGSDWPVCTLAGDYEEIVGIVMDYMSGLSRSEQAAILGGTAEKAYNLKAT